MSTESIQYTLQERFAAPLPDFYRRRIIFWHDEEREFEDLPEALSLPDVKVIRLTGTNNFAVKKLLLHDDLTSNYLIYDPLPSQKPEENWLRDIELFSEQYRADRTSLLMSELNIEEKPALRKAVKLYRAFFKNRERTEALRKIGRGYKEPKPLHLDIMAVLCGLPGGSAQDIIIAVLSAGLDEAENTALCQIKQFGNIDAFWKMVYTYTGFLHHEETSLRDLAFHILLTAISQTMGSSVLKGLERYLSEAGQAFCYSLVSEWRSSEDCGMLFSLCRDAERELKLPTRFEQLETETLLTGDLFPAIHESILNRFFTEISEHVVKPKLIYQVIENRRISGWYARFSDYYECLFQIAEMQTFYEENADGFHLASPEAVWKFYTEKAYKMDRFYRHFHAAFGCTLRNSNPVLEDGLKHTLPYVEGLYQNWYLGELSACWTNVIKEDLSTLGFVSEVPKQKDFYRRFVHSSGGRSARTFVIISDALRYEVAAELCDIITRAEKGTAKLECVQAVFPSITKFGMAALLPARSLSVNDRMEVLADGLHTRNTAERGKVLRAANPKSVATAYTDVLNMKRADRRSLVSGKEIVYIYHNTIDAVGDDAATEQKVFDACAEAVRELSNLLRIIISDMAGTDILITADHGFLYTYSPLAESDKLSQECFSGTIYEIGRRYALAEPSAVTEGLLPVKLEGLLAGTPIKGYAPQGATRIKIRGGGANYVHGGVSLQELAVPVIHYKNLRASSKGYVEASNAELAILTESRKITNIVFSLEFFQRQPVGGKIRPCTYNVQLIDEGGKPVSDRKTVIADRSHDNASERVFRVRFHLSGGVYDKEKTYRLVISNGVDLPVEIPFRIDVLGGEDFGF